MSNCCKPHIVNVTSSGGGGGGPYLVVNNGNGTVTVTDTGSGNNFTIDVDAVGNHIVPTAIDFQATGNPDEYTVTFTYNDEDGNPIVVTDATPVIVAGGAGDGNGILDGDVPTPVNVTNAGNLTFDTGADPQGIVINGTGAKLITINGDIDVTGTIDPDGLVYSPLADVATANTYFTGKGYNFAETVWLNATDGHLYRGTVDLELTGAGSTNLDYTASPTNGAVTSSTGTDATIPLVDGVNAGLATPAILTNSHLDDDVESVGGTAVDNTDPRNPIINISANDHVDDDVETVTGTAVDNTDTRNPIVNLPIANQVNVTDAGGFFVGTEVEAVLQEIGAVIAAGSDGVVTGGNLTGTDLILNRSIGGDVTIDLSGLAETVTSLSFLGTTLTYTDEDGIDTDIDLVSLVQSPATATSPAADDNTGAVGSSILYAREDHKHPAQGVSTDALNSIVLGADGLHWSADEVIENAGTLAGAAPNGAQFGVDTTNGTLYYVDGGNWTTVPTAGIPTLQQVLNSGNIITDATEQINVNGNALEIVGGGGTSLLDIFDFDGVSILSNDQVNIAGNGGAGARLILNVDDATVLTPTTGAFILPNGSDPDTDVTTPTNGMLKYDSTDHEIRAYINGAWVGIGADTHLFSEDKTLTDPRNHTTNADISFSGTGGFQWQTVNGANIAIVQSFPADGQLSLLSTNALGASGITQLDGNIELTSSIGSYTILVPPPTIASPYTNQEITLRDAVSGDLGVGAIADFLNVDEVIENAGVLTGAAPADAQFGIDTTSGQLYYVNGGNWTTVPTSTDTHLFSEDKTLVGGTNRVHTADGNFTMQGEGEKRFLAGLGTTNSEVQIDSLGSNMIFTDVATLQSSSVVVQNIAGQAGISLSSTNGRFSMTQPPTAPVGLANQEVLLRSTVDGYIRVVDAADLLNQSYQQTFVIGDFVGSTLTIPQATHGLTYNANEIYVVQVYDSAGNITSVPINVNQVSGDVTVTSAGFDGRIIISR